MSKSAKYTLAAALLLGINLAIFFTDSSKDSSNEIKYFQSIDLTGLTSVIMIGADDTTKIDRSPQGWILNDQYAADAGFVNTLISVLERVETSRTIGQWDASFGKVKLTFDSNTSFEFEFDTNPTKTKTYFINDGIAKEVAVPGYRDNVADILTLHSDQWRDRMIFDGSWRTIQRLSVTKNQGEDFEITFDDKFFLINQKSPADSSAIVNYLNQYQQFQANEMISVGRFPDLDSISSMQPFAQIQIEDIKNEEPFVMSIYPSIKNQPYHLAIDASGQRMVIDSRRVQQILQNPNDLN
ncbi:hypothetical protein [Ekhidna sp.]|uniref:hypothetical protein n=1 Tax=Ekhidna sp. TaxID=2608089 RepID=UPI003B4FFA55